MVRAYRSLSATNCCRGSCINNFDPYNMSSGRPDEKHRTSMDLAGSGQWVAIPLLIAIILLCKLTLRPAHEKPSKPLPPVATGVPLLGVLPGLLTRGPLAVISEQYEKLGSVFAVNLFGFKVTFLVGPEVSAHFYQGLESEMSQDEAYRFTVPTFGAGVGFDVGYSTRLEQFRFFGDAMRPAKLRSYVGLMVREVEDYFSKWGQSGTVDLKHEFEQLVTLIASRCLFGKKVREQMFHEVSTLLRDLSDGMTLATIALPYLPTAAHRRRDRARAKLADMFSEIVRSRKQSSGRALEEEDDILQHLMDCRYRNGRPTTEAEIAGMLVSALFAGQHTSSSTSTWTGARLLSNERYLNAAVDEQRRVARKHGGHVGYDALQEMDVLHRCIKEALRLHPPSLLLLRHARRSFMVQTREGAEYEVPGGHMVATPLVLGHGLGHVYREPHKYDPDRFAAGREEARVGGAFAYTGFGAGRHACLGEAFAYMQIKVIWSHLLRRFELELVSPFPETDWNLVMPGPKGEVMVSYTRRSLDV